MFPRAVYLIEVVKLLAIQGGHPMKSIVYVGVDVDSKGFSIAIFYPETGEIQEHRVKPQLKPLLAVLEQVSGAVRVCYEAGFLGFSLCRSLREKGYHCDVVAPSLIPKFSGDRIKTDRLDAAKLARFYATNLLTAVHVPDIEDEAIRGLVRSRQFLVKQLTQVKNKISGLCRSHGWDYREETCQKSYWTVPHKSWLKEKISGDVPMATKIDFKLLLKQFEHLGALIQDYEEQIREFAQKEDYQSNVQALTAFRSIDVMTAMSIITELGDINRFDHPRRLTSYVGLDIAEYSSGGAHKRFGITRLGNAFLRYAVVEATQFAFYPPKVSRALKKRREGVGQRQIEIADRCMERLYKKGSRLLFAGKNKNKVKVALARELLAFIWETLKSSQNQNTKLIKGTVKVKRATRQPTVGALSSFVRT